MKRSTPRGGSQGEGRTCSRCPARCVWALPQRGRSVPYCLACLPRRWRSWALQWERDVAAYRRALEAPDVSAALRAVTAEIESRHKRKKAHP